MSRTNKATIKNIPRNYSIEDLEQQLFPPSKKAKSQKYEYKSCVQSHKQKIKKHNSSLEKIAEAPELIGIPDQFYHPEIEVGFYDKHEQKGSADLVIETKDFKYVIEYKSNDSKGNKQTAKKQLMSARKFLKENYGMKIDKMLYVWGKFKVLELTNNGWNLFPPYTQE
ncbi:hypothetical protein HOD29_04400 [archaeon]|jgi:hypothetical protein|nr:hypothetical protein [archaeon]